MACGPVLSEKALARFRTKPCERLLAQGRCHFQEKCQYSHQSWVRRSPLKVNYKPQMCCAVGCEDRQCPFAHTQEEVLYHPLNYKVSLCKGCKAYYCPFAHGADLRQAAEVKAILANSEEEEEDVGFHRFDDRLRILREDWAGGSSRGLRGEIWEKSAWRSCLVRTIHYTRAQRKEADQIMRELRVWTKLAQAKPLAMRRSVASLCVAWPQGGDLTFERAWGPRRAAALLWQLAGQLRKLHTAGIAHCCLCPRNIFLKGTKCEFKLGDFLPKLRLLSALGGKEEDLDLWLPAEVHQKLEEARRNPKGNADQALDFFAVDLWQLGAIGLWALTGHEPRRRADVQKLVKLDGSELTRVIAALLDDVPSKRPCAAAVRRRLGEDSILGQVDLPEDPSRSDREEPSLEDLTHSTLLDLDPHNARGNRGNVMSVWSGTEWRSYWQGLRNELVKDTPELACGSSALGLPAKVVVASGLRQLDASYNPAWLDVEEQDIGQLEWLHSQTGWAAAATGLYAFDMFRFFGLVKPSSTEALVAVFIYLGLYASRIEEVRKMEKHYQVSFYASCGWTFYALASLIHAISCGPEPMLERGAAESLHTLGAVVFLLSCGYFYSYHWGRIFRHIQEGRSRPFFALGLGSLTFVHGLTVGHIWKMMEDPGWYDTVQKIYPDQWQWIADTRMAELYLTALALFLVILHLRGVLTGTANATWVFLGTVIVPTVALFYETFSLRAVAWQHYWMYGPKHW